MSSDKKNPKDIIEKRDYGVGSRDNSRLDNLKKDTTTQQSQTTIQEQNSKK